MVSSTTLPRPDRNVMDASEVSICCASVHVERPLFSRLDVVPFALLYGCAPLLVKQASDGAPLWAYGASLAVVGALHAVCMLMCVWSVPACCWLRYVAAPTVQGATHARVTPHRGLAAMCPIVAKSPGLDAEPEALVAITFQFQHRTFEFNHQTGRFKQVRASVDEPISYYANAKGLGRPTDAERAQQRFGSNRCSIPRRTMQMLLAEQFTAPFFVFQVFCVLLWCLDEYWHYSLFTLFMLVLFECTMASTRLKNEQQLYAMEAAVQPLLIWREGRWKESKSTDLLPGDLFALQQLSNGKETVCPCDGVLLAGKCVMNEVKLTGESVPQMKDSITALDGAQRLQMDQAVHRPHVLYGGTKLVMVATPAEGEAAMPQTSRIPAGESGACLVYALRTGFGTSQGELMRTILFATNGGGGLNNAETFLFIGVLLVFAVISSAYVMHEGLKDPERSRWKLFLNCTLIITSVIPPELPMELSLAVNTSLAALMRKGIFCTEPFRIPLAGKVDICCFDKTGTLTSDKMVVHGVAGLAFPKDEPEDVEGSQESNASPPLIQPTAVPIETSTILAACNSLVLVKQNVFGDPLERVALDAVGWRLGRNDKFELKPQKVRASIVARYHFDSSLRRMSVLAAVETSSSTMQSGMYVLAKGAPETMEQLYDPTSVPRDFSSVHHHYSLRGGRVLALGYKQLTSSGTSDWTSVSRTQAESSLIFAGFLVLSCPMKASSLKSVTALRRSSHRVVMITGDNMLTACYVASTLRFFKSKRRALVLHPSPLQWQTVDEDAPVQHPLVLDKKALDALESKFALCISGDSYAAVLDTHSDELERVHAMLPRIKVFARMSPEQKEAVVITLSDLGLTVLMCGDGTNDVGALKQAHVGVGLLEAGDSESGPHGSSHTKAKRASKKSGSLQMLVEEAEASSVVQLGDASIASPFTSRTAGISCTLDLIKQGRCTLVTTTQMSKIIAVNCLTSAYSLSVLYLDGVKYGDTQATAQGLLIAGAFLFVSRSKPLEELSDVRPFSSLFAPGIALSVFLQFAVHLTSLITISRAAKAFERSAEEKDPDADFKPNVLNSCIYVLASSMTMCSFWVNYRGFPFMEGLRDNRSLLIALSVTQVTLLCCATGAFPELNESLELVTEWPRADYDFSNLLLAVLILDFGAAHLVEAVTRWAFPMSNGS